MEPTFQGRQKGALWGLCKVLQVFVETFLRQRNAALPFPVCQHRTSAWSSQKTGEFGGVRTRSGILVFLKLEDESTFPQELGTFLPRQGPLSGRRPDAVGTANARDCWE